MSASALAPVVAQAVGRLLGSPPAAVVPRAGGYTRAVTGLVTLADGRTAFLKSVDPGCPAGDPLLEDLGHERDVLLAAAADLTAARHVPRVLASTDDPVPLLLLEDLSGADWPLPYPVDLGPLVAALAVLAAVAPPASLTALTDEAGAGGSWHRIAADPGPFLALATVDEAWLRHALPALIEAEARVQLGGDRLVHGDLWYANLCFAPRGPVIVDWGSAMRGNATLDRATVAMDLVLTGRDPAPLEVPDLAAWLAFLGGHLAREATEPLPPIVANGSSLRADQLADAAGLLDELVDLLDLPARDPRPGVAETAPLAHTRPR